MISTQFIALLLNGVLLGSTYALITVGLTLCFGVMGILNFAHGSIVMLAMYGTYFFFGYLGLNPYISIFLIGPLFFVFGILLQTGLFGFTLNAPPNNQFLVTLGLLIFLNNFAQLIFSPDFRTIRTPFLEQTLSVHGIILTYPRLLAFTVAVVCFILLKLFLENTHYGKAIRATAQNRDGAKISGINVSRVYLITTGIASMLAGVAGVVLLPFLAVAPNIGNDFILTAFIIIVLAGIGNIGGTFWSAMLVGMAESLGAAYMASTMKYLAPFIIFILVLLFRPKGLFSKGK